MPPTLRRSHATAGEFHAADLLADLTPGGTPVVWEHEVTAPALVLGSTQRDEVVDHAACAAQGVEVVRRRSGGGAVLLLPGAVTWLDVVLPAGGVGWSDDVHRPMVWVGEQIAEVLRTMTGRADVTVHTGAMVTTPWSRTVCFDGVGAGEVLLGGAKLVGISQRRTRTGARLQCCWYSRHDPATLAGLLASAHRPPVAALGRVATLPAGVSAEVPPLLAARLAAAR